MVGREILRGDPAEHDGETTAQPGHEPHDMEEQPEASHVRLKTSGNGCRPANPASSSCQCVIRSSPNLQHHRISRSSSPPWKSTSPRSNPLKPQAITPN